MSEEKIAKPAPAFPGVEKAAVYKFNPYALAIMGGADALPKGESSPLDTPTDKDHPLYDERLKTIKLTTEFVSNIRDNGVREVINIVKIGDVPFVANGRTRVRAARVAMGGPDKPPIEVTARLVKLDDVGMLREMVITNLHFSDGPTTKIAKLKRLIAMGVTIEDAAAVFATRPATVKAWLQYDATAIPAVKKAVAQGKIPQSTGADIARLEDEGKQQKALDKVLATAVTSNPDRRERTGAASKARRAIAEADGKSSGVSDKKTLKKLLAMLGAQTHKGDKAETVAWWRGVADAISFVLGGDAPDERLTKLLKDLDSAPPAVPAAQEHPRAEGKPGRPKKAPEAVEGPPVTDDEE